MPRLKEMALLMLGTLVLPGVRFSGQPVSAQTVPPPVINTEMRHARNDFASGGAQRLAEHWNACVEQARNTQDANAAERCIVYGYGAVLLGNADKPASGAIGEHRMTVDALAQSQFSMLTIMGIPEGPKQAWLARYQRWVSEDQARVAGARDAGAQDTGATDIAPESVVPRGGSHGASAPESEASNRIPSQFGASIHRASGAEGPAGLALAAAGKYPGDALRQPEIANALHQLVGQAVFARLQLYGFGSPMKFNGRYTTGAACGPRSCGVTEARYVFSPDDAWVAIVEDRRLRVFGHPPKQVRALLSRERNRAAWGSVVEETGPRDSGPAIQTAIERTPDEPPRMSITPRPIPVSMDPMPRQSDDEATQVRLQHRDGNYEVPVTINGAMTLSFAIDSGASDVTVSSAVLAKLIQSGTVSRGDFLGKQIYHLADGSAVSSETFRIHALRVGDREVHDVMASVSNDGDTLLLGQSFLARFRSWSIDNQRQVLLLK